MNNTRKTQSQRREQTPKGAAARTTRPQNKDHLKSDRTSMMAGNPAAQRDQFGTRHNKDAVGKTQKSRRNTIAGEPRLDLRESAQDTAPKRGQRNRQPGRRRRSSGSK